MLKCYRNPIQDAFIGYLAFEFFSTGTGLNQITFYKDRKIDRTITLTPDGLIYFLSYIEEYFNESVVKIFSISLSSIPNVFSIKYDTFTNEVRITIKDHEKIETPSQFSLNLLENIFKSHECSVVVEDYYNGKPF